MIKFDLYDLVEELIRLNRNILIVDTCCLLDIIRFIQRKDMGSFNVAIDLRNQIKTMEVIIVYPSLVYLEWTENQKKVMGETYTHLVEWRRTCKYLDAFLKQYSTSKISAIDIDRMAPHTLLGSLSRDILESGIHLEAVEECRVKALDRVIRSIAPAKKGKDSTKDCVIFEEVLLLSSELRKKSFEKMIVFASSNTKEYVYKKSSNNRILEDLEPLKVEFASSLNEGVYIAKNEKSSLF